jgi:hypothetical protein
MSMQAKNSAVVMRIDQSVRADRSKWSVVSQPRARSDEREDGSRKQSVTQYEAYSRKLKESEDIKGILAR